MNTPTILRPLVSLAFAAAFALDACANPNPDRIRGLAEETRAWRSVGPGGGGYIQSILWSRHARDRLLVGCDVGGFYISEDGGRHYEMRNRGLKNFFIETIAEHPRNPDILFLGSEGGIYKTTDRGRTWQEKRGGLPPVSGGSHSVQISRFAFLPGDPNVIYAAVGQPRTATGARGEVWRSDDLGESWRMIVRSGLAKDVEVFDISISARDAREMLVATNRGVFRSEDGGESWVPSNEGLPPHLRTRRLARCEGADGVVYVTLRQKVGDTPWLAGVYRSEDGGRTWAERTAGLPKHTGRPGTDPNLCSSVDRIVVDRRNPDRAWVGGETWWQTGLWRTEDGGRNWARAAEIQPKGWITFWGPAVSCLSLSPLAPGRIAFGTSGMVYVTEDGGDSWMPRYGETTPDGRIRGTGLEVTCLHNVIPSKHVRGKFFLGYYDIGLLVTQDGGKTMARQMNGIPWEFSNSCFAVAEAPDDPNVVWGGFGSWGGDRSGCIAKSVDGGKSWQACTNVANGCVLSAAHSVVALGKAPNYRVLCATGKGLVVSRDGGTTWTQPEMPDFPEARRVSVIAQAPGRIYFGANGSGAEDTAVFVREAGSRRVRRLTPAGLPLGSIRRMSAEGERILVTTRREWRNNRVMEGGAWLSADGGKTWENVYRDYFCEGALVSDGELYVATHDHPYHDHSMSGGVIHSKDDGKTWTHLDGPGLQSWAVSVVAANPFDRKELWLGTAGNSVFVTK